MLGEAGEDHTLTSTKVVGTLRSLVVPGDRRRIRRRPFAVTISDSVIGFLRGELGDPPEDGPSRCVRKRWTGGRRLNPKPNSRRGRGRLRVGTNFGGPH